MYLETWYYNLHVKGANVAKETTSGLCSEDFSFPSVTWSRPRLGKHFEGACPNLLQISKKSFRVTMGNFKSKIRSWSFP